jgi:prolyl oligopeptidase
MVYHMKRILTAALLSISAFGGYAAFGQAAPPVAPVRPVTEDLFGIQVVDPYRYMEKLDDPEVKDWMKAQAEYTRGVLDKIPGRAGLYAEIDKYVNAAPAVVSDVSHLAGGKYFFLKTLAGQSLAKLYVRDGIGGTDELLVDTDKYIGPHGEPPAINYYSPSDDGRYVAYGVSQGGSEMAVLHIIDVQTQKDLPETIDRAEFGGVEWRDDNQSFFYNQLQKLGKDSSPLDKYQDSKMLLHVVGQSPDSDVVAFARTISPQTPMTPDDEPGILTQTGSKWAIGAIQHGVQNEQTLYVAPVASLGQPGVPWVKLCDVDADVTDFTFIGDDVYLLTHKDAPRFAIVKGSLVHPDQAFVPFVPQTAGVLKTLTASADALYATELDDGVYHILRVPWDGGATAKITLPFEGYTELYGGDPRLPGITFELASWTKGPRVEQYDPGTNQVTLTDIRPAGPYDNLEELTSEEVEAPSYDGTDVPLSIVYKKGLKLDGSNPTIIWAYGAYGITEDPGLGPSWLAWLEHGGVFACAHVRGGGERGEEWHMAGYKLTKPNTWRDTIGSAEYLIDKKYTSPARLSVWGGSAGGITVGRTITERPDLFAAAVPMVGCLNPLRQEFSPNGPPNIPEFGSVTTQEGFEDLYAMDSLHHVRDGVKYPATLITTGMNDPRVASWEPAKFCAAEQAATASGKPVLLRIDFQGGHGIGASRKQREAEYADEFSFCLWQFGVDGFQPK